MTEQVRYNTMKLRELIVVAFDDDELNIFCRDYFREFADSVDSNMGKTSRAFQLVAYCERREKLAFLEDRIKAVRPYKYQAYEAELKVSGTAATSRTEAARAKAADLEEMFESANTGVKFKVGDIQASTVNIYGQVNREPERKASDTDQLPLVDLPFRDWQKIKDVFVPSSDYQEKLKSALQVHKQRVYIIYGRPHTGRFTCAAHLGADLCRQEQLSQLKCSTYRRTVHDTRSLYDFVRDPKLTKPVFDRQIVTSCNLPSAIPGVFFARPRAAHLNNRAQGYPARHGL